MYDPISQMQQRHPRRTVMTTVPAPYNDLHTFIFGGAAPEAPMDAITRVAWNWIQSTEQDYPWKDWISTHVLGTIGIAGWALESVNSLEESIRLGHTGIIRFEDPEASAGDGYYPSTVLGVLRHREKAIASGDVPGFYAAHLGRLIGEQFDLRHRFEQVDGGGLEVLATALAPRLSDLSALHDRLARTAGGLIDWTLIARHLLLGSARGVEFWSWRNRTRVCGETVIPQRQPDRHAARLALAASPAFRREQQGIQRFCDRNGWAVELGGSDTDGTPFRVDPRPTANQVDRFLAGFAPVAPVDGAFDRAPLLALCALTADAVSDEFDDANFAEYAMVVAREIDRSTASLAAAYINQSLGSQLYDVQTSLPVRDGAFAA